MQSLTAKYRYLWSVILFFLSTVLTAICLLLDRQFAAVGFLSAQTGFFIFVANGHLEQAATLERLQLNLNEALPILMLAKAAGDGNSSVLYRLTQPEAVAYNFMKVGQARRVYNTCFSVSDLIASTSYRKWLSAIAENVIQRDCIVEEVMGSPMRQEILSNLLLSCAERKGEYTARLLPVSTKGAFPYMELSVFENQDGTLEALFGWATDAMGFLDEAVFLTRNEYAARFLLDYFKRLQHLGR